MHLCFNIFVWYVLLTCFNVSHNSFESGQYIERACFYLSVICLSILSETFIKDFIIIIISVLENGPNHLSQVHFYHSLNNIW